MPTSYRRLRLLSAPLVLSAVALLVFEFVAPAEARGADQAPAVSNGGSEATGREADLAALRDEVRRLRYEVARLSELLGALPSSQPRQATAVLSRYDAPLRQAQSRTIARTYNVADLVVNPSAAAVANTGPAEHNKPAGHAKTDFASLEELVTSTIEPKSWQQSRGEGTIQRFPRNLSLVITQTAEVHERIADLFDQLRRVNALQVSLRCQVITLPAEARVGIALPPSGAKQITADEARALVDQAQADRRTSVFALPTVTIWPAQVANFKWSPAESHEAEALIHTVVASDRRSARLSVAVNASDAIDALRSSKSLDVPDGDTLVVDITDRLRPAPRGSQLSLAARLRAAGSTVACSSNEKAIKTLLLVTPQMIAPEEGEALLNVSERDEVEALYNLGEREASASR
jgi:hypothetical protein